MREKSETDQLPNEISVGKISAKVEEIVIDSLPEIEEHALRPAGLVEGLAVVEKNA